MRPRTPLGAYLRGAGWRVLVFAVVVAAVGWLSPLRDTIESELDDADSPALTPDGAPQVVFEWSSQACEGVHIPDLPARAFVDDRGSARLLLSNRQSRWMVGPDLDRLEVDCAVALRSTFDARPQSFDDREWIASLWSTDGRNVTALVHHEYQGHLHPGRCPQGTYFPCWYNAITIAHSRDGGRTFTQPPPGARLIAASPRQFEPGAGPNGAFSPSNIVPGPGDGYVYAMYNVREPGGPRGTCLMRTRTPGEASSWRSWDGDGFDLAPVDPYRGESTGQCATVAQADISEMRDSLTYNTHLGRYLLVGMAAKPDPERGGELVYGIYFSLSEDLLHWTPRELLLEATTTQRFRCGDPAPIAYPSLIDPASDSRVFSTTGRTPYLYFTRFNYSGCRMTLDRDLLRLPVTVSE